MLTEKDQCLLELVDELGDDRFFRLARTAATRMSSISKRDLAYRSIAEFEAKYLNRDLKTLLRSGDRDYLVFLFYDFL